MNKFMQKQFELTRGYFIKNVEMIPENIADVQPEGFNNTIHWHIGHVLTVGEQFLLGFPHKSTHLPANYIELFGNGTKPADWKGDVPSIGELTAQLKEQLGRIKEVSDDQLDQTLEEPFMGLKTFRELAGLTLMHESNHLGEIKAMKRVVEQEKVKS
ncbi:DinB family protein [Scopulibacillus darangshiensis]|uniref:DinB family protein n=1 Tax=Scopulibacillus darangshiensis TaxID=442528 RepID=A0A4R2P5I8_9BACL|nr:DinB family protein [Scopulibacillus darangshiensis]TCP29231.1 DinB family protein [Scopulibacillus darangshiensis]